MSQCPDREQLEAFLQCQDMSAFSPELEKHFENCPDCQAKLEETSRQVEVAKLSVIGRVDIAALSNLALPLTLSGSVNPISPYPLPHLRPFTGTDAIFTVGPYQVLEEIGRGGMGVVYKARHEELGRLVALKVLGAGLLNRADAVPRFRAEARALARLRHPNIVGLFEIGEWAAHPPQPPVLYFVLEYVPGGGLDKRLRQGELDAKSAARMVELLAGAVHHANLRGVIHRDLKPGNVLLEPREPDTNDPSLITLGNGTVVPKIADYGLALLTDERERLTNHGELLGTPNYMAPEQVSSGDIGPPTDVYGLGAILYEMLAGQPPFAGSNAYDVLYRIRTEPAPLPSTLRPNVPAALQAVCMKCLQKDPSDRYLTARELADDLARYRRGETVRAQDPRIPHRGLIWALRIGASVGVIAMIGVIVLMLAGGGSNPAITQQSSATATTAVVAAAPQPLPTNTPIAINPPEIVAPPLKPPQIYQQPTIRTLSFRNGENGYAGTHDTELRDTSQWDSRNKPYFDLETCRVVQRGKSGTYDIHSLIRFDAVFGHGAEQVPLGSDIVEANLSIWIHNPGDKFWMRRMLGPWDNRTATWNSLTLFNNTRGGIQADDLEASIDGQIVSGAAASPCHIDLLDDIRRWANGEPNYGWACMPTGAAGTTWRSSEFQDVARRPQLLIRYRPTVDRPRSVGDWYPMSKDRSLEVSVERGVLANDLRLPAGTIAVLAERPKHGVVELRPDGSFRYTPEPGYVGRDQFMYKVRHEQHVLDTATAHVVLSRENPESK